EIPKSHNDFFKLLNCGWSLNVTNIRRGIIIMNGTLNPSSFIKYVKTKKSIIYPLNLGKCIGIMN
ncbi:hypothetical protein H8356DRAFT_928034, partial [Neocallimastix lanati (nom. inval.)]